MSEQETANFRFDAIEQRLDKWEEKVDAILGKIDALRTELLTNRCSQPNLCVLLRSQLDEVSKTITKLNDKIDKKEKENEEKLNVIQNDISSLNLWRNYLIGGFVFLMTLLTYFSNEIKNLLLN